MDTYSTDVLILGGGTAALRAAVAAVEMGVKVMVLQKGPPNLGIVAFNASVPDAGDTPAQYFNDMLIRGQFLNDFSLVAALTGDAIEEVRYLERLGMCFTHNKGSYCPRLTSGNSIPRTIYTTDRTGPQILSVLKRILREKAVPILQHKQAVRLLVGDNHVLGALVVDERNWQKEVYKAGAVVLATGGLGPLYSLSSNHSHLSGDGYALAYWAGAELVDMEFVQFEPFVIRAPSVEDIFGISFLLDDDPKIYNNRNKEFLPTRAAQLGKDILSRLIFQEIQAGRGTSNAGVFFDVSHVPSEKLELHARFLNYCQRIGVNPMVEPVEAGPAQHYMMGGVRIDPQGNSSLPGLFAAGEVAGGVHGADRLAGNSGTDVLVFGARAGKNAAKWAASTCPMKSLSLAIDQQVEAIQQFDGTATLSKEFVGKLQNELQKVMWNSVGLIRDQAGLENGLKTIIDIEERLKDLRANNLQGQIRLNQLANQLILSKLICRSAIMRKESRGVHYRSDFSSRDDRNWLRNIAFRQKGGSVQLELLSHQWVREAFAP